MTNHIDDILVITGIILLGVGIYFYSGALAVTFYAGVVCLIAGGVIAKVGNGRRVG